MNWKFWEKKTSDHGVKLDKPRELPSAVGKMLVVDKKYDPDWVWHLKIVTAGKENQKYVFDFRIFDPDSALARKLTVLNYNTLESCADLILFDGWYDKDSWKISLNDHYKSLKKNTAA